MFAAEATEVYNSGMTDHESKKPVELPALPQGVKGECNVEYAHVGGHCLRLDVFMPGAAGPRPVVVWVHGGGWRQGDKEQCPGIYLAEAGFAVASIEYRLSDTAPFPAHIHDCKAAIRFLRANAARFNLDPGRIGAWGCSAGGHLVALLGATNDLPALEGDVGGNLGFSSRVQAVCNSCGVGDLFELADEWRPTQWMPYLDAFLGGPIEQFKDKAAAGSPVTHIAPGGPPFYSIHGDKDDIVPVMQSIRLDAALRKAGVPSTLEIVPGGGHGMLWSEAMASRVLDFFKQTLA